MGESEATERASAWYQRCSCPGLMMSRRFTSTSTNTWRKRGVLLSLGYRQGFACHDTKLRQVGACVASDTAQLVFHNSCLHHVRRSVFVTLAFVKQASARHKCLCANCKPKALHSLRSGCCTDLTINFVRPGIEVNKAPAQTVRGLQDGGRLGQEVTSSCNVPAVRCNRLQFFPPNLKA